MSRNDSPFIIVSRRPRTRLVLAVLCALWALSLVAVYHLAQRGLAPDQRDLRGELRALEAQSTELSQRVERLRQRNVVLKRSDDVSRAANQELQQTLADREEKLAALEADVAFFEKLVGGSAERRGLSVHSLDLAPAGDGAWRFRLTLTQNLKKTQVTSGKAQFTIEGVQGDQLEALDWDELLQEQRAPALAFQFKYFQQLEGSVMLPAGFVPHRVRVRLDAQGEGTERVFAWQDTQQQGA
jgi:hypothetical protein